MITLQLAREDALFLREQLARHLQKVEGELVRTDAPRMQHDLARDLERLRSVYEKLVRSIDVDVGEDRASSAAGGALHG